jgi:hypothetical protein
MNKILNTKDFCMIASNILMMGSSFLYLLGPPGSSQGPLMMMLFAIYFMQLAQIIAMKDK